MSKAREYREAINQASAVRPEGLRILTINGEVILQVTPNETAIMEIKPTEAINAVKVELDINHLRAFINWAEKTYFEEKVE